MLSSDTVDQDLDLGKIKLYFVSTNFVFCCCLYRNTNVNLSSSLPRSRKKVQLSCWQFSVGKIGGNDPSRRLSDSML